MKDLAYYGYGEGWKFSEEDPGYAEKTIVVDNVTCTILRPLLEPEERKKREKQIMSSIARTMAPHIFKDPDKYAD